MKKLSVKVLACAFGVAVLLVGSGCASLSTMHNANTLEPGQMSHTISGGSLTADVSVASGLAVGESEQNETSLSVPMFEYMFRYGIVEGLDFGLRTTGLVHGADIKWKFLDLDSFKMATGLALNYLSYEIAVGSSKAKYTATDITIPLFLTLETSAMTRLYAVPKYLYRGLGCSGGGCGSSTDPVNFMGGSVGFEWGNTAGVLFEYTMLSGKVKDAGTSDTINMGQTAVAFFFR